MKKFVSLILAILLCFSFEDTPQSKVILSNELIEKTENQYYKINEIKEKIPSEKQSYSRFLAEDTCGGPYISTPHWVGEGCNQLGQCTEYFCGVHSVKQVLAKFGIDNYDEYTLAEYAGTTPDDGTSHEGIEAAFATVGSKEGVNFRVEWNSFGALGDTNAERFKAIGEIICHDNVDVIIHNLYRNTWGHYETVRTIDVDNEQVEVLNSLGDRAGEGFLGYREWRTFDEYASYIAGISQLSICFVYKE